MSLFPGAQIWEGGGAWRGRGRAWDEKAFPVVLPLEADHKLHSPANVSLESEPRETFAAN